MMKTMAASGRSRGPSAIAGPERPLYPRKPSARARPQAREVREKRSAAGARGGGREDGRAHPGPVRRAPVTGIAPLPLRSGTGPLALSGEARAPALLYGVETGLAGAGEPCLDHREPPRGFGLSRGPFGRRRRGRRRGWRRYVPRMRKWRPLREIAHRPRTIPNGPGRYTVAKPVRERLPLRPPPLPLPPAPARGRPGRTETSCRDRDEARP